MEWEAIVRRGRPTTSFAGGGAHGALGGAGCSDLDCRDHRVLAAEDVRRDRGGSLDLLRHPRSRFMLHRYVTREGVFALPSPRQRRGEA
jgi:hypothetical protein